MYSVECKVYKYHSFGMQNKKIKGGSMKPIIVVVLLMFVLNIVVTGILQDTIKKDGNRFNRLEATYSANHARQSFLIRERQELLRRDRIINYAQQNLDMQLLRPDEIASGQFIKEIHENQTRNNNVVYSLIDFLIPSANAFEVRR